MPDNKQTASKSNFNQVWPYCIKSTQYSIHSRRCFMTGEFCSKQANVHREREKLHKENKINAFVIMNFSEMSDVVYKWKLQSFVESLKKHLYLDKTNHRIACVAQEEANLPDPGNWTPVTEINVIRADSNTETNYVICNRVCQQMQIADLIIVDVSVENTNVFYEFGMAMAFNKLILPICYSDSFYEMKLPKKAAEQLAKLRQENSFYHTTDTKKKRKELKNRIETFRKLVEHHIDTYPWRRKLFEHYGIRYRQDGAEVGYSLFRDVINPELGFSDERYNRFPYDAKLDKESHPCLGKYKPDEDAPSGEDRKKVGYHIYNLLRNSYNNTTEEAHIKNEKSIFNTLVVYTMDDVLNEEQAGQCIINFYRNMTAQIRRERCFCGDRIGILGQGNAIYDDPKDTTTNKELQYKVSEIIRIGMNQATYVAQQRKIKTEEFLNWSEFVTPEDQVRLDEMENLEKSDTLNDKSQETQELRSEKAWYDETIRFTKEHIRNRCIPIYPDEPIYVKQLQKGIQQGILDQDELEKKNKDNHFDYHHFFNLFHVMLYTLRYTNQIVVDLSRNSLQALFWLGMAHGSDVHAITVRHIPTKEDLERSGKANLPNERSIFDVAGLWTAILRSNDTESFYRQLAITQIGIEQHSKLTLSNQEMYHERIQEQLYAPSPYLQHGSEKIQKRLANLDEETDMRDLLQLIRGNKRVEKLRNVLADKNREESKRLESFYRDRFWRRLLRYNDLRLFLPRKEGTTDDQPRLVNITWDVDSMAELSHYLSKRKIIGSYRQYSLPEHTAHKDAHRENFISIGGDTTPLRIDWENDPDSKKTGPGISLVTYVQGKSENPVREMRFYERDCPNSAANTETTAEETEPATKNTETTAKEKVKHLLSYRGFFRKTDRDQDVFTQFVTAGCVNCSNTNCQMSKPDNGSNTDSQSPKPNNGSNTDSQSPKPDNGNNTDSQSPKLGTCTIYNGKDQLGDSFNHIYMGCHPNLPDPQENENPRKMPLSNVIPCTNQRQAKESTDTASHNQNQSKESTDTALPNQSQSKESTDTASHNQSQAKEGTDTALPNQSQAKESTDTASHNQSQAEKSTDTASHNQSQAKESTDSKLHNQLQLGRLLLWREVSIKENEDARFWVSLEGISGPATYALTTLLVDDRQKADLLDGEDQDEKRLRMPLNSLQKQVRKKFTTEFTTNLDQKLGLHSDKSDDSDQSDKSDDSDKSDKSDDSDQSDKSNDSDQSDKSNDSDQKKKVKYAACLYLSTVLYQYFLPFLSKADEDRICNGMHAYLCAMEAADGDNFKSICDKEMDGKKILQIVEEALQETVHALRGVEALYAVKVSSENSSSDTRKPVEIRTLRTQVHENDKEEPIPVDMVSCLFHKEPENSKTS